MNFRAKKSVDAAATGQIKVLKKQEAEIWRSVVVQS